MSEISAPHLFLSFTRIFKNCSAQKHFTFHLSDSSLFVFVKSSCSSTNSSRSYFGAPRCCLVRHLTDNGQCRSWDAIARGSNNSSLVTHWTTKWTDNVKLCSCISGKTWAFFTVQCTKFLRFYATSLICHQSWSLKKYNMRVFTVKFVGKVRLFSPDSGKRIRTIF